MCFLCLNFFMAFCFNLAMGITYELSVSTPRCVYVISELICKSSRFSRHTRSLAIANSAFNNSGSCRILIELLDEHTARDWETNKREGKKWKINEWFQYKFIFIILLNTRRFVCFVFSCIVFFLFIKMPFACITYSFVDLRPLPSTCCIHLRQVAVADSLHRKFPFSLPTHLVRTISIRVAFALEQFSILVVDLPIVLILQVEICFEKWKRNASK